MSEGPWGACQLPSPTGRGRPGCREESRDSTTQPKGLTNDPSITELMPQGLLQDRGLLGPFPWQPLSICSKQAPGGAVSDVLGQEGGERVPSAAWHPQGLGEDCPYQIKARG